MLRSVKTQGFKQTQALSQ